MPLKTPFECVALMLQGGGALGSYQGGVYEALAEIDLHPNWIAGISIGAINAAIIAGNRPKDRVDKLRQFWEGVTTNPFLDWTSMIDMMTPQGNMARTFYNQISSGLAIANGASDFFAPRPIAPYFLPDGSPGATSYYDTSNLRLTLERLVDFDLINDGTTHLTVGAVNVRTGNTTCFDTADIKIRPEHIIASGSLPPSFPATEIDGEFYWDGGMVSNTPLQWVVDGSTRQDTLAIQVDLWPAEGELPRNLLDVATRQKEIQYSSRTRAATDAFKHRQMLRGKLADLMAEIPEAIRNDPRFKDLKQAADHKQYSVVHLIYHAQKYEGNSKDYDFSRLAMNEHWKAGLEDARRTLAHKQIFEKPDDAKGLQMFDFAREDEGKSAKTA